MVIKYKIPIIIDNWNFCLGWLIGLGKIILV